MNCMPLVAMMGLYWSDLSIFNMFKEDFCREWKVNDALMCSGDDPDAVSCNKLDIEKLKCLFPSCQDPKTELKFDEKQSK